MGDKSKKNWKTRRIILLSTLLIILTILSTTFIAIAKPKFSYAKGRGQGIAENQLSEEITIKYDFRVNLQKYHQTRGHGTFKAQFKIDNEIIKFQSLEIEYFTLPYYNEAVFGGIGTIDYGGNEDIVNFQINAVDGENQLDGIDRFTLEISNTQETLYFINYEANQSDEILVYFSTVR
jgi:hypothetical protein